MNIHVVGLIRVKKTIYYRHW